MNPASITSYDASALVRIVASEDFIDLLLHHALMIACDVEPSPVDGDELELNVDALAREMGQRVVEEIRQRPRSDPSIDGMPLGELIAGPHWQEEYPTAPDLGRSEEYQTFRIVGWFASGEWERRLQWAQEAQVLMTPEHVERTYAAARVMGINRPLRVVQYWAL